MNKEYFKQLVDHPANPRHGFKVVSVFKGEYYSAMHPVAKKYQIYKPTYRNVVNGPLAVFKNKLDATKFIISLYRPTYLEPGCLNLKLFKCYYFPSKDKDLWFNEDIVILHKDLPKGTALADIVIITKEIKQS